MQIRTARAAWTTALGIAPAAAHAQAPATGVAPWLALLPDLLCSAAVLIAVVTGALLAWRAVTHEVAEGFGIRRAAGGFGGAGVGWRVSAPFARLLAGLAIAGLGVVLALARVPAAPGKEDPKPAAAPKTAAEETARPTVASAPDESRQAASSVHGEPDTPKAAARAASAPADK